MDVTRVVEELLPTPDGESALRHRTGTVDAVNADGTVDLDLGGTVVPDVSVLAGAVIGVGETVQVVAWAGDLLVIGGVRTADVGGPLGALGYAEVTASQGGLAGTLTDLTGLSTTVDVAVGRRIKVTGYVFAVTGVVAGDEIDFFIREGSTTLQRARHKPGQNQTGGLIAVAVLTPSAGSHTYKLSYQRLGGSGTHTIAAASTNPAFILVEDIGPA